MRVSWELHSNVHATQVTCTKKITYCTLQSKLNGYTVLMEYTLPGFVSCWLAYAKAVLMLADGIHPAIPSASGLSFTSSGDQMISSSHLFKATRWKQSAEGNFLSSSVISIAAPDSPSSFA